MQTKTQYPVINWNRAAAKASEVIIKDNKITMLEQDREGNKIPVLTYWIN